MTLTITAGHATRCGKRERNEDFVGMVTPDEPERSAKGVLAAVADGVSGNDGGREASEYTVRGLLSDYYATPDTWSVAQALERVLKATNSWVQQQGTVRPELSGMATTLTCLVLRGTFYYFAHVGDTRLYLLRAGALTRLTTDHVWDRPEMQHVLTRAIGLDSQLTIDHGMGPLHAGDVFLLASDGVWAATTEYELAFQLGRLALGECDNDACADALLDAALEGGSGDNLSALVMRVDGLPQQDLRDSLSSMRQLPLPPPLRPGQLFEGLRVERMLHASAGTVLYKVAETAEGGRTLVLKTLQSARAGDALELAAFAHEEWLARRAVARFFPQVITPAQKNHLYYLTTWHDGATLAQRLEGGQHFTVPEVIALGEQLVRAVGALHRRSIIHRDIKPDNVHLGADGQLRLLDLGVAQSGIDAGSAAPQAGTPSFLAPEQFDNAPACAATDLYAVGVTLYFALTRHYPYGEVEPFQRPRFGEPIGASRYRPDLPLWLWHVLQKALAREAVERFETAEEFLLALERGAARPLPARAAPPLATRNPAGMWRAIALLAIAGNLVLLYLLGR
ncbi:bifunctional protein-serine/threonine kinase/phosphatase [Massilia glaciei]|uniref:Bifunctional protein-serine/threonine kinase/phosphatase n=1 Tax=Massilia glaciei TaxID=1524097 RepID=A0A2U2I7G6_9BURK|nr:bifunctional protein-serine/threonine kinase/phosphatase [Massilia glaciei]PWF55693.1 bifunctional protein-serine/threonine kinase/phosphatase [Massilia glaciei]